MFKIVSRAALSALLLSGFSAAHAQGYPPGAYPPGPYADPRGAYLGTPYGYPGFPDDDEDLPPPRYGRTLMPPAGPAFADPADDDDAYGAPSGRAPSTREADLSIANGETTKQVVADPTGQPAGTLIVDTRSKHLYLTLGGGQAYAYGIGVGREGFAWKGTARVGRKAAWPTWTPPSSMLLRRPDLPRQMAGGPDNPLGARALYLYQGNKDTLFRIHGTNEPDTIGKAVSSGCIRMMNADVIDLFQRVPVGARVVVI